MNPQAHNCPASPIAKEVVLALTTMVQQKISEGQTDYDLTDLKDLVRTFNDALCSVWIEKNLNFSA